MQKITANVYAGMNFRAFMPGAVKTWYSLSVFHIMRLLIFMRLLILKKR
jgi:hypothetical protein